MPGVGGSNVAIRRLNRPGDREIADLARRQDGVVAYWQLIELGFSANGIQRRVAGGRLHRLFRGVYAVGHMVLTPSGWRRAAVLACGDRAVLSHLDAAAEWALLRHNRRPIHVTAPRTLGGQRGITVHRIRTLDSRDRIVLDGIPITTIPRTLLDIAEVAPDRLKRAAEAAERRDPFILNQIPDLLARSHGRRGAKPLRRLLTDYVIDPAIASDPEGYFRDLIEDAGIAPPVTNTLVLGYKVDAYWPDHKLIVEIDSYAYHSTTNAFNRDRERDVQLQLAGYVVLRFTDRQLQQTPAAVTDAVRRGLDRKRKTSLAATFPDSGGGEVGSQLPARGDPGVLGRVRPKAPRAGPHMTQHEGSY